MHAPSSFSCIGRLYKPLPPQPAPTPKSPANLADEIAPKPTSKNGVNLLYSERHQLSSIGMPPALTEMSTWTARTGKDKLRSFKADDGSFWLEQNPNKRSKWSVLAKQGHNVAWEFGKNRLYTGRIMIDGEILALADATTKFLSAKQT